MESLSTPKGLIVDLITPLKNNGAIDGRGLERLLAGVGPHVQAILLAGPNMGEGENLEPHQRLELLEKAMDIVRLNPIPIMIWGTRDTAEKTKNTILTLKNKVETQKHAGQVFFVDTSLYYHSNRGLPALYKDICSTIDVPIILHNDPEFIKRAGSHLKRNNIRTAILKALVSEKNIPGMIFSGALDRAHNYHLACRRRSSFSIYDGDETRFLDHPSISGLVSAGANLAPAAWQKIIRSSLHLSVDNKKYPDHLQQIWELGNYLRNLKDIYQRAPVIIIKEVLADIGIIETPTSTLPAVDVEQEKNKAKELMSFLRSRQDCRGNRPTIALRARGAWRLDDNEK
ncbi:MAG: dihydrodipicolinate synthase family protein [Desulfobacterales bacterium]|nr:dihydrodipicolinate synthase family protein [Desulfobacterales bacterium]